MGNAADAGHRMHSTAWETQHDAKFQKAIEDVKPYFKQCSSQFHRVQPSRNLCVAVLHDLRDA